MTIRQTLLTLVATALGALSACGAGNDWDKVLLAAHLWLALTTQKEAAKGAGIGERSLQRWIKCGWWKQACTEVEGQWIEDLAGRVRGAPTIESSEIKSPVTPRAWSPALMRLSAFADIAFTSKVQCYGLRFHGAAWFPAAKGPAR